MPLLADYALTPDVFDTSSYSSEQVCSLHLQAIKPVLLTEGIVRDLRNGEWRRHFSSTERPWHQHGKELLKKLAAQGRFVWQAPAIGGPPGDDHQWCREALATHAIHPFRGGIIVTERVKSEHPDEPLVARIDRLGGVPWWNARSSSVRLARRVDDYCQHLELVLRCANSIMFIDPHLDPTRHGYQDFRKVLVSAANRSPVPLIEIHRVCYEGSGRNRKILEHQDLERRFREGLDQPMAAAGLRVDVFAWDDFHDRYVISNILGVSVPNLSFHKAQSR